ncbi:MAG: hypothetical protein KA419_01625 [Acidobacteria bacterium]|nr:hypothetical protein [Acidobacteriota bacterium]
MRRKLVGMLTLAAVLLLAAGCGKPGADTGKPKGLKELLGSKPGFPEHFKGIDILTPEKTLLEKFPELKGKRHSRGYTVTVPGFDPNTTVVLDVEKPDPKAEPTLRSFAICLDRRSQEESILPILEAAWGKAPYGSEEYGWTWMNPEARLRAHYRYVPKEKAAGDYKGKHIVSFVRYLPLEVFLREATGETPIAAKPIIGLPETELQAYAVSVFGTWDPFRKDLRIDWGIDRQLYTVVNPFVENGVVVGWRASLGSDYREKVTAVLGPPVEESVDSQGNSLVVFRREPRVALQQFSMWYLCAGKTP